MTLAAGAAEPLGNPHGHASRVFLSVYEAAGHTCCAYIASEAPKLSREYKSQTFDTNDDYDKPSPTTLCAEHTATVLGAFIFQQHVEPNFELHTPPAPNPPAFNRSHVELVCSIMTQPQRAAAPMLSTLALAVIKLPKWLLSMQDVSKGAVPLVPGSMCMEHPRRPLRGLHLFGLMYQVRACGHHRSSSFVTFSSRYLLSKRTPLPNPLPKHPKHCRNSTECRRDTGKHEPVTPISTKNNLSRSPLLCSLQKKKRKATHIALLAPKFPNIALPNNGRVPEKTASKNDIGATAEAVREAYVSQRYWLSTLSNSTILYPTKASEQIEAQGEAEEFSGGTEKANHHLRRHQVSKTPSTKVMLV
ncbi:hypothetical protein CERZMDRAFT_87241 [Cercospora zeae-maydis SCOH1-5]|uniref:Uncharacterized protein n=1 Tax=Cercospora zeae-maydis SCOH1-5 TaxID=717836 RepID=A0A6A6F6H8_9PEZI|nr:hypothetical protein CERZMDRAFT_87241 [Cercospora zeae-maydis SCOH1-5]